MEFKKYVSNLTHLDAVKQFNSDVKEIILDRSEPMTLNDDYNGFKRGDIVYIYTACFIYFSGNACCFYMNSTDCCQDRDAVLELDFDNFTKNVDFFISKNSYLKECI